MHAKTRRGTPGTRANIFQTREDLRGYGEKGNINNHGVDKPAVDQWTWACATQEESQR